MMLTSWNGSPFFFSSATTTVYVEIVSVIQEIILFGSKVKRGRGGNRGTNTMLLMVSIIRSWCNYYPSVFGGTVLRGIVITVISHHVPRIFTIWESLIRKT
jgi:hypothetical protein